ncbi:hypothetical protein Y032_0337g2905 [Ancylostoma ceylanicum]|uniref:Uncharacterized protein n=1 Tax=Ancylostoma ceylanicum TaxID=53326 RepID=A0A016RZD5_9BILA|nr:hypothetical protein Y032_0337g2905 [Ancylostoma ceylanicum]
MGIDVPVCGGLERCDSRRVKRQLFTGHQTSSRTGQDVWGSQMDCSEDVTQSSFGASTVAAPLTQPSSTSQRRPAVDDTPQFGGHYSHSTGDVYRQPSGPQPHRHPSFDETPGRPYNKVQTLLSQRDSVFKDMPSSYVCGILFLYEDPSAFS